MSLRKSVEVQQIVDPTGASGISAMPGVAVQDPALQESLWLEGLSGCVWGEIHLHQLVGMWWQVQDATGIQKRAFWQSLQVARELPDTGEGRDES